MAKVDVVGVVALVLIAIVVVIVIAIIIRHVRQSQRRRTDSSQSDSRSPSSSSSSSSESSSGHRHRVRAPNEPSNYKVMNGKPVEQVQEAVRVETAQTQEQARVPVNAAFPRHVAKAGRPNPRDLEQSIADASRQAQAKVSANHSHQNEQSISVQNGKVETIYVESMADLYSPKEDLEAELGVDKETLDKMVESYKKSKEYRERQIPANRHFDLDKYKASKDVLRASAANMGVTYGSKRGQITGAIYKKYGKNFTTQRSQPMGDVHSLISSPALHEQQMRLAQERKNQGHLEVRN